MKKLTKLLALAALGLASFSVPVLAVPTPYGSPGTINGATYTFTATGNGSVIAYFVDQSAGYGSVVGLSINGAAPTTWGLQNHASVYGSSFNMGTVATGDILRFVLDVSTSNGAGPPPSSYKLNSDASLNGGAQHIYSYAYGGDAGGTPIPAGTYVGFEDISPLTSGDLDYDDHQFVFTGPGLSVPDGGMTIMLLGLALSGLGYARRLVK